VQLCINATLIQKSVKPASRIDFHPTHLTDFHAPHRPANGMAKQSNKTRKSEGATAGRIVCVVHRKRFLVIDKKSVNDGNLSFRARGIHHYLMGKPETWVVQEEELINSVKNASKGEGRDAIRVAIDELKEFGYFMRVPRRKADGTLTYVTLVFESPEEVHQFSDFQFEALLQSIVPGSTAFQAKPNAPKGKSSFSANGTASGFSVSGISDEKTVDWKTVDGEPHTGPPVHGKTTLQNTEGLNTQAQSTSVTDSADGFAAQVKCEHQKFSIPASPHDGEPEYEALKTELLLAGIAGNALCEMLGLYPELVAVFVRDEWTRLKAMGKGSGILLANLRAKAAGRGRKLDQIDRRRTA
jgi:hypothetical protein